MSNVLAPEPTPAEQVKIARFGFDKPPAETMTVPEPTYAPLTEQEFSDGCGYEFRGIPLCEDEQANWVYAWGHRNRRTFAAAVNDYDRELGGFTPNEGYKPSDVEHRWAVTEKPADDPDGWYISWESSITADTPNAFKLTVVSR